MMKRMVLALFGLAVAFTLIAPPKANAQVRIGIGVGLPRYVVVEHHPYYSAPAYYGDYAYAAPVYGGGWYGRGDGYRHEGWSNDRRYDGYRHEVRYENRRHDGYRDEGRRGDRRHDGHRDGRR
jgi:hypothetical protein